MSTAVAPPRARITRRIRWRLWGMARRRWYRLRHPRVTVGRNVSIQGRLRIAGPGRVVIGDRCTLIARGQRSANVITTLSPSAVVSIGERTYLNGTEIVAQTEVRIGSRCLIADCGITDTNFHSVEVNRLDPTAPVRTSPVVIGDNVWVGGRVLILRGVSIGENSVVGAGTVVRSSVPENVVVVGGEQRIVKHLDPNL